MFRTTIAFILLFLVSSLLWAQDDPAQMIQSKDLRTRLRAIDLLQESADPSATKLLLKALKTKDWQTNGAVVEALGMKGDAAALNAVIGVALKHPLIAVREAASRAAAQIDRSAARTALTKSIKGKKTVRALEALREIGLGDEKKSAKLLYSEDPIVVIAAARARAAFGGKKARESLMALLQRGRAEIRAGIAEGLAASAEPEALPMLLTALKGELRSSLQRRYRRAVVSLLSRLPADGTRRPALVRCREFLGASNALSGPSAVELLQDLARGDEPLGDPAKLRTTIEKDGLGHKASEVRATAARVLGEMRLKESFEALAKTAAEDKEAKVRFQAVVAAMQLEGKRKELLDARLQAEESTEVLEEVLAQYGKSRVGGDLGSLRAMLRRSEWKLVLAAAVSLGRMKDAESVPDLRDLLSHDNWRIRGAGVTGMAAMRKKACFEPMLKALGDKDPIVRNTALDGLQRLTGLDYKAKPGKWQRWWKSKGEAFVGPNDVAATGPRKIDPRYADGFVERPYDTFKNVLVVVLTAPRDELEKTLDKLKIKHTLTRRGEVSKCGLHPRAVFFANCPGNIDADDAERLDWFVRAGGSLFTTCIAVFNIVERVFPGMMTGSKGQGEAGALDAEPVYETREFVTGVFHEQARPRYQMAANQVIVPLRRERVRVVLDSVTATQRWGAGDMAAFFRVGHGLVMDSANHFALQGMGRERLKTEDDRRAYALERLGLSFREVRKLDKKKVFRSHTKAAKACPDYTVMRLAARFVFARQRLGF